MRTTTEADELDLPPLDGVLGGEEPEPEGASHEDLDDHGAHHDGDAFDDATSESDPLDLAHLAQIGADGAEAGWLVDSEDAGGLDVGAHDVSIADEGKVLEDDEPEHGTPADEELGANEEAVHTDGGEEGPLAEDEELREEDLPALDADEDGDVSDESLFERGSMEGGETGEELRWDDRAWARVPVLADQSEDADDSGMLAVPGEDPKHGPRDATWRRLEETGRITAATLVPGESVVIALDGPERPVLVRILTDGVSRIIAEIDNGASDDEVGACRVTGLRWDIGRGCLVATGNFGAQAFRPA
jgi:hypothetical protein